MMLCFFVRKSKSNSFLNGFRLFSQPLKGVLEWCGCGEHLDVHLCLALIFFVFANHKALKNYEMRKS